MFLEVHAAVDHIKAKSLVSALRLSIVDKRVRSHLGAAMLSRPVFRRFQQPGADALSTRGFDHEPTFDVAHGICRVATVSVGAQTNFYKSRQGRTRNRTRFLCDKDRQGQRSRFAGTNLCFRFELMLARRTIRPEQCAKRAELVGVCLHGSTDEIVQHIPDFNQASHPITSGRTAWLRRVQQ
jgi:hypothetical protein